MKPNNSSPFCSILEKFACFKANYTELNDSHNVSDDLEPIIIHFEVLGCTFH
jgi:hypothetical protein